MEAMKAKNPVRLSALRNAKKYMLEAKTAGPGIEELSDAEVLKIISKLAKQGTDSAAIFVQQNRQDLADGGRLPRIPSRATLRRGADRRGAGHHCRDGCRLGEGDGQGDGHRLETPCGPGRREGYFGQGPGAACITTLRERVVAALLCLRDGIVVPGPAARGSLRAASCGRAGQVRRHDGAAEKKAINPKPPSSTRTTVPIRNLR